MDLLVLLTPLLAGFLGGFVRGYAGFGFGMAAAPILIVSIAPTTSIPAVLIHEMLIGLMTLRNSHEALNRRILKFLIAGSIVGTPIGLGILYFVPAATMRPLISITLILAVIVIWSAPNTRFQLRNSTIIGAGFFSGVLNGAVAASGPPAILLLLSSDKPTHAVRSVLIWFICFSGALALALSAASGLVTAIVLTTALIMAPAVLAGAMLGSVTYARLPSDHYRTYALLILLFAAVIALTSTGLSVGALAG